MKVLVTGASGFVGRILCPLLKERGHDTRKVIRSMNSDAQSSLERKDVYVEGINSRTDWRGKLNGIDVVVHLAAKVHVMQPESVSMLTEFREVNVEGSARLVAAAADAGVARVVYLSSIKVNGEETFDRPFRANQTPAPVDPYGISKTEAEIRLRQIESDRGIEVVIIRPPLVYGPNVKGNLLSLSNAIERGLPLPFGAVRNRRDLVSIYNLCDLIAVCVEHLRAAGHTFLVSDNEPLSTADLIHYIANARSVSPRLLRISGSLLRVLGTLCGRKAAIARLTGNLEIDASYTHEMLGWMPPLSVAESFSRMYSGN